MLMKAPPRPLNSLLLESWFMRRVLHLSNGETVHVRKKPAVKAAQNWRRSPSRAKEAIRNYLTVS
jgi:hypothetical protein